MAHKDSLTSMSDTDQLVVSYELLLVLRWIIEHDQEGLKSLLSHALVSSQALKKAEALQGGNSTLTAPLSDDLRHAIIDFFDLLETLLAETSSEQSITKLIERKLMPAIEHIDSTVCDDMVVQNSIEKTAYKIDEGTVDQAQEVLFKELLKQWKPSKKSRLN